MADVEITRESVLDAIGPLGHTPMTDMKISNVHGVEWGHEYDRGRADRAFIDAHLASLMADGVIELVQNCDDHGYRRRVPETMWSLIRANTPASEGGNL